mgnify:CR=1 FL=1
MKKKCFLPMMLLFIFTVFISSETVIGQPIGLSLEKELQKLREADISTTIEELNLSDIPDKKNGALVYRGVFKLIDDLYQQHKAEWEYFPAEGMVKWEDALKADKQKVADLILHNPGFIRMYQLLDKASYMKCDEEVLR